MLPHVNILAPDIKFLEHFQCIDADLFLQAERSKSAGSGWFDMPAPQLTPELKNDLRLLRMRGALDPARHYKKTHSKATPRYFQVCRPVLSVSKASTVLCINFCWERILAKILLHYFFCPV